MERRKLTKEDINKVRDIEGFPIGTDEDIITLSDAPYYTACPNPFIEEFIREHGTPYDEETDDYHREPFAADVSEGKSDPIYNTQSYVTKVPHKAIMRYILHYTKPGDIVFDGFCGTGMTAVAAQLCDKPEKDFRGIVESEEDVEWGGRYAIISDLSPAATFVAANYNHPVRDIQSFLEHADNIMEKCEEEYGWMFKTNHVHKDIPTLLPDDKGKGRINYVIWSDVFICPHCGEEFVFWNLSVDKDNKKTRDKLRCTKCGTVFKKRECKRAMEPNFDHALGKVVETAKQTPVLINYSYRGNRYDKEPDEEDRELLKRIDAMEYPFPIPTDELPQGYNTEQPKKSHGYIYTHQFYTKRNLIILSAAIKMSASMESRERSAFLAAIRSALSYGTKMVKVNVSRMLNGGGLFALGTVTGTLYIPSNSAERSLVDAIKNKVKAIAKVAPLFPEEDFSIIGTGSLTDVRNIGSNSVDYIFTDPPFGDNLNYSELNFLWESWQRVITNNNQEAIINSVQQKSLNEYQSLMMNSFKECYRILKPNRWMTVEFHNSKNSVWNAIQEALLRAGFIIADVRTLDKQQGSFKQMSTTTAVKQDLVISAYKPKERFIREFRANAGSEETAWNFIRQHLSQLPIAVDADKNGKLDVLTERQAYLLYDRMVAYHIMQGVAVPVDANDFYEGLDEHFLKRDNMYFLPDQVNEYDLARATAEVEEVQLAYLVTDERTAIQWLYNELKTEKTYQEIMPEFMKSMQALDKHEKMPELAEILEENFLKDDDGKWYIPDLTKSGDIAKLREKNLLKEFQEYLESKGKLKVFRSEAVRAGFAKLWKDKDYKSIVNVAERLPEKIIQEDPNLLMYYDISLSRI